MIQLRPHQINAVEMLRDSMRAGHKRIMLGANVSFGKTIVAAHLMMEAHAKGKRGVFICDRIQLVEQALAKFEECGLDVGVIQGNHEKTRPWAPIQVASIQTMKSRNVLPEFDFAIVDEAHTMYKALIEMMQAYNNVPFIGLSATPYSKGLGKHYTDLIVPITARELLDMGWLCPIKYYAGEQPDLEKIKLKNVMGVKDYDQAQLSIEMEKPKLIGDVVATWKRLGEDSQTIAFCPSISHSRGLVAEFERNGIGACHVDAYSEPEVRKEIYARHDAGEFKILSCSSLLNTGYDSPSTRCIIDCYPTKSLTRYVQRAGRIMRTFPGKEYAIFLDHSSNVCRHGFAEDIVPDCLHDGEKEFKEESQVKKEEKKEPVICDCCSAIMVGGKCPVCGHETKRKKKELEVVPGELQEVKEIDQAFYSGLLHHARTKGYADGWAKHKYREKFGTFPIVAKNDPMPDIRVAGYIKHLNIKRAKSNKKNIEKGEQTIKKLLEQFDV
jgi:DNA repair protein RadD